MQIIYQDDNLIVYDKPAGINCDDFENRVHRLDKDTSGIFLVAKNATTLKFLQAQFKNRTVEKKYLALVYGHLKITENTIETLLGRSAKDRRKQRVYLEKEPTIDNKRLAITHYKLLQRFQDYDLIELKLETGRKHQIRAHLSYLGCPIVGDKLYRFKNHISPPNLERQFLHASFLSFRSVEGKIRSFTSALPADLNRVLKDLKTYAN